MGTKTIGIREEVYERLRARKRDDESVSDLIDRLIDDAGGDWREGFGTLSTAEAETLREAAACARESTAVGLAKRQSDATERLASVTGDCGESDERVERSESHSTESDDTAEDSA